MEFGSVWSATVGELTQKQDVLRGRGDYHHQRSTSPAALWHGANHQQPDAHQRMTLGARTASRDMADDVGWPWPMMTRTWVPKAAAVH
jgi:hypothetical protein